MMPELSVEFPSINKLLQYLVSIVEYCINSPSCRQSAAGGEKQKESQIPRNTRLNALHHVQHLPPYLVIQHLSTLPLYQRRPSPSPAMRHEAAVRVLGKHARHECPRSHLGTSRHNSKHSSQEHIYRKINPSKEPRAAKTRVNGVDANVSLCLARDIHRLGESAHHDELQQLGGVVPIMHVRVLFQLFKCPCRTPLREKSL